MECICSQKCMNICPHGSKCQKKCCEKCVDCIEECTIGCIHRKCNKLCHEQCDIRRCNNRCSKKLKCGHQCIGLCGERCPRVCRECDPNNECFDILETKTIDDINNLKIQDIDYYQPLTLF